MDYVNSHYTTFDSEIPLKEAKKYSDESKYVEKLAGSEILYDFCQFDVRKTCRYLRSQIFA